MNANETTAIVQYGGRDFFIATSPSGHAQVLDTDGKRSNAPSPMEALLGALGSCTAVDVVSILQKKRMQIADYRIELRGERRDEYPRSFRRIEVRHIIRGRHLTEKAVANAIHLSDTKYCSVAATLRPTVEIVSSFEITNEDE